MFEAWFQISNEIFQIHECFTLVSCFCLFFQHPAEKQPLGCYLQYAGKRLFMADLKCSFIALTCFFWHIRRIFSEAIWKNLKFNLSETVWEKCIFSIWMLWLPPWQNLKERHFWFRFRFTVMSQFTLLTLSKVYTEQVVMFLKQQQDVMGQIPQLLQVEYCFIALPLTRRTMVTLISL